MVLFQTSFTLRIAETSILPSASFVVLAHPAVAKQVITTAPNTFVLYWVIAYNISPTYTHSTRKDGECCRQGRVVSIVSVTKNDFVL